MPAPTKADAPPQSLPQEKPGWAGPVVVALVAAVPAVILLGIVLVYGVNVPYWDDWDFAELLRKVESHTLTFSDLAAQHSEYRPLVLRLVFLGLAYTIGWHVKAEMLVTLAMACLVSWNVYVMARQSLRGSRTAALGLLVAANLLIFAPIQWEVWLWGAAMAPMTPNVFVTGSLALVSSRLRTTPKALLAILLATVGTWTFAPAMYCWLGALVVLAVSAWDELWKRKWLIGLWLAAAAANLVLYFHDYVKPSYHPRLDEAINRPGAAVQYFLAFLGSPLARVFSEWGPEVLAAAEVIGVAMLMLVLGGAVYVWRRRRSALLARQAVPWLVLAGFVLAGDAAATVARLGFGVP